MTPTVFKAGKLESRKAGEAQALTRAAIILIWAGYVVVGLIVLTGRMVAASPRLNIGAVMGSVLMLGGAGVLAASALLAGSALGTYTLITCRDARRVSLVLNVVIGWIGFAVLAWLLWGFWTN